MTDNNMTIFDRELELFVASMQWTATSRELQSLVLGNLRGFIGHLNKLLDSYKVVPIQLTDAMRERMIYLSDGPERTHDEVWAGLLNVVDSKNGATGCPYCGYHHPADGMCV